MKKIIILSIISMLSVLTVTHFFSKKSGQENSEEQQILAERNESLKEKNELTSQTEEIITIREMADFLESKKEHYPLSDEFIERYQQTSGGYIDYARQKGLIVNKALHEPNQKWHFFTSWLDVSIEEGTLTWEDDAKKRVYTNLLCPELLLWIYEASEVEPIKVKKAKEVAEEGKVNNTRVATIAKNMRSCVSWEDVSKAILKSRDDGEIVFPTGLKAENEEIIVALNSEADLNDIVSLQFTPKNTTNKNVTWSCENEDIITLKGSFIKANQKGKAIVTATSVENKELSCSVTIQVYEQHFVSIKNSADYAVNGLKATYEENETVHFSIEVLNQLKEIEQVTANEEILTAIGNNEYSFLMPSQDVAIEIKLKDKELKKAQSVSLNPDSIELFKGEDKMIIAEVTPNDTTDRASWEIMTGQDVISIIPNGNQVKIHALKEGSATVRVTYNQDVYKECTISVKENELPIGETVLAKYNIQYDLEERKTAKSITTNDELMQVFQLENDSESIITSFADITSIYGGGNGGRGDTSWYASHLLKIGTTSLNGSLTLSLNSEVNRIRITGYVSDNSSKIRVGNSASTDWTDEINDNQTTLVTCSDMNEASKDIIENKLTSTITIDIASTKDLKIATTNKKPIYITSIEFIMYTNVEGK